MKRLRTLEFEESNARHEAFREMFGSIGENVHIDVDFHCEYGKHIFIGNKTIINQNCTFIDNNYIRIGNNVLLHSHTFHLCRRTDDERLAGR